jgi:hypothetical protein
MGPGRAPHKLWYQEGADPMLKRTVLAGAMIALAIFLWSAGIPATQENQGQMFSYNYTFKPGSEPDGFRELKWQTDIATLDPLHTMEVIEIVGPFTYYKKNKEDLQLVTVKLDNIIYEFWNGKFSGVIIKVKGANEYQILKEYVFSRFGPGQRSKILEQMDAQDFYYNGVKTRMTLKFSDLDRIGELSIYSIALLSKQQKSDSFFIRERAKERIDAWEKTRGK